MTLLYYYSNTGNSKLVASKYQEKYSDTEVRELVTKRKMPKSFFGQMMVGGFLAGIGKKDKLVNVNLDIEKFDEIVIASPIWNGKITPAVNMLLSLVDLKNKKLKFIFQSGSGEGKGALKKVNKLFPNSEVIFLKEPKKYPDEFNKL